MHMAVWVEEAELIGALNLPCESWYIKTVSAERQDDGTVLLNIDLVDDVCTNQDVMG